MRANRYATCGGDELPRFTDEELAALEQDLRRRTAQLYDLDLIEAQREQALFDRLQAVEAERAQVRSTTELTRFGMFFAAGLAAVVGAAVLFGRQR